MLVIIPRVRPDALMEDGQIRLREAAGYPIEPGATFGRLVSCLASSLNQFETFTTNIDDLGVSCVSEAGIVPQFPITCKALTHDLGSRGFPLVH